MRFKNYLLELEDKENRKNKENICIYGISPIVKSIYLDIKELGYGEIKKMLNNLNIPYQTFYSWTSGSNPIPISKTRRLLKFWKKILGKTEAEFEKIWDYIYVSNKGFSQNGQRKVILPKEINQNLGYLIGFFQGDGHLKKENISGFQEYSLYFYEGDKEMTNQLNDLIQGEFKAKGKIYLGKNEKGYKWCTLRITSKPIYLFFKRILGLKSGKKVGEIEAPEVIKKSNLSIQLSFIRGFFDAEGTVGENKKNPWLEIGQASKDSPCEILCWIRKKLEEKGIILSEPKKTSNQEFFRIRTAKRETIKRFFDIISSDHLKKISRFDRIINR